MYMTPKGQFYEGQIITLKSEFLGQDSKDFYYTGRSRLFKDIKEITGRQDMPNLLQARVVLTQDRCTEERVSVEWINPFTPLSKQSLGIKYGMKEYEFQEYVDYPLLSAIKLTASAGHVPLTGTGITTGTSSIVIGHTHVAPGSYTHGYDLGIKVDSYTFEEVNPDTQLSFKSTKLVANKIQNSKEIDNFLLLD